MRFAWLRKKSGNSVPAKLKASHPLNLAYLAYNAVYWVPIILTFARVMDYRTGFIAFFAVILVRSAANLARNNVIKPEIAETFPLRS
jgi:hypothetical protein